MHPHCITGRKLTQQTALDWWTDKDSLAFSRTDGYSITWYKMFPYYLAIDLIVSTGWHAMVIAGNAEWNVYWKDRCNADNVHNFFSEVWSFVKNENLVCVDFSFPIRPFLIRVPELREAHVIKHDCSFILTPCFLFFLSLLSSTLPFVADMPDCFQTEYLHSCNRKIFDFATERCHVWFCLQLLRRFRCQQKVWR